MFSSEQLHGVYCTFIEIWWLQGVSPNELRKISSAQYNGLMDFFTDKISIVFSLIWTWPAVLCRLYCFQMSYKFSVGPEMMMICMS